MIPLRIHGADMIMKAPPGQEDIVRDLHAKRIGACYVSRWEPTPEEIACLAAGGSVELWCQGGQPPVMLTVAPHLEPEDADAA